MPVTIHHAAVNGAASAARVGHAFATFAARGDNYTSVGLLARAPRTAFERSGRGPTGCGDPAYQQGCLTRAAPDESRLRDTGARSGSVALRSTVGRILWQNLARTAVGAARR